MNSHHHLDDDHEVPPGLTAGAGSKAWGEVITPVGQPNCIVLGYLADN
ncbi:MAG TPA: hypothetical protein QF446_03655 [Planctomycetota bacterium]|nr:hypothetical protein [Planctomycetota bacterium]